MAQGVDFPQSNMVWKGNGEDVYDLHAYQENGVSTSCWQLSEKELEVVKKTGKVWLCVMGQHPPVNILGEDPLGNDGTEEAETE